jgi:RNA polymerase sigma-70 factor, ECF subfamily
LRPDEHLEHLGLTSRAKRFGREEPFGVDLSPTSATRREVGMDQGSVAGQSPISSDFDALLIVARRGNAPVLGSLLESFQPYLMSIARRELPSSLRGKYDAADLVQETLLEAHRGLEGFHGTDSDALRVWLCGILRHNLMDLIRRYRDASKRSIGREQSRDGGRDSGDPVNVEIDPNPTPCTQASAREDIAAIREVLRCLPADEQAVILLRDFESLSYEEIGHRLDRSPEAARKLWGRAILRLRRLLKERRKSAG